MFEIIDQAPVEGAIIKVIGVSALLGLVYTLILAPRII